MNPKILVVDDDESIRKALAENLEKAGYAVVVAARAQEGLNILIKRNLMDRHIAGHKIDLVITDYIMSDTEQPGDVVDDGEGMIKVAKRHFLEKNVVFPPAIIQTGCTVERILKELGINFDVVFTKPIDLNLLLKKVAELLPKEAPNGKE